MSAELHQQLRKAVGCLNVADRALAKIAGDRMLEEAKQMELFEPFGEPREPCAPAKTEARWKLVAVRRELQDALRLSEAVHAGGEDAAVLVALEQHASALEGHEEVLKWCDSERDGIARYKVLAAELERKAAQTERARERLEAGEGDTRAALSERLATLEAAKEDLARQLVDLRAILRERGAVNMFVHSRNNKLERDNAVSQKKASRAREVLAQRAASNLKTFRAAREAEMAAADEVYRRALAKAEEYLARLQSHAQVRQDTWDAYRKELREDIHDFQRLIEGKKAESARILQEQMDDFRRELIESEQKLTYALRRFKELLHEKRQDLNKEVASGKRAVQTAVEVTRRQMEVHLEQLRVAFRHRLQLEKKRIELHMKMLEQGVAAAIAEAKAREHQASVTRENFRMHAINSKTYVKTLDTARRKRLFNLHWRVD